MKRIAMLGVALIFLLTACGGTNKSSSAEQELQHEADVYSIDQIEQTWHKASSLHNVDLMMSIWAPDATFTISEGTLSGKAQIRKFFATEAGSFKPENHWVSDTPAYKIRITVSGDKGTLYFECHYVDVKTQKVVLVVAADQDVERINGKWLITSAAAATPTLGP